MNNGGPIMKEKVQEAINQIRPNLQADGGDVDLIEVTEDGIVKVKLLGACQGCPMSQMTLKKGIQKFLQDKIPEVKEVVSVA
jgi:Fe-S cluster biogenesis protein NfuA